MEIKAIFRNKFNLDKCCIALRMGTDLDQIAQDFKIPRQKALQDSGDVKLPLKKGEKEFMKELKKIKGCFKSKIKGV
jgi:hypothetical protein